jgi:hypothetical protein
MVNFTCPVDRQPDVMWMGGVSEFVKVVALASACGVPVVPHGCGVYGYFMAMAFNECPLCEFMMMSEQADRIEPNFGTTSVIQTGIRHRMSCLLYRLAFGTGCPVCHPTVISTCCSSCLIDGANRLRIFTNVRRVGPTRRHLCGGAPACGWIHYAAPR